MKSNSFSGFILFFILTTLSLKSQNTTEYNTQVIFPAGYNIGDFIEFVRVIPASAGAAGYYEISIAYTRENMAAAATHIASISHANPSLWRETGRINANTYVQDNRHSFTVDCNTQSGNSRFRVRAINTFGTATYSITVFIKIRSINITSSFVAIGGTGNDTSVNKFLPMTNEWDLYVGNPFSTSSANIVFKVKSNGNVGIGTLSPQNKLDVNGVIRAKEIKVETGWADFVFDKDYKLPSLAEVERHIQEKGHLQGIPTEIKVKKDGVSLGEMNVKLLQKVEELTLYLIMHEKEIEKLKEANRDLNEKVKQLIK
ncbi:Hypothetical protein PEIBARAKI_6989 [Petrimonas sp. IBARAKI]|nr:Hypothetical protein PEIBARAKI_6989 [Petrimonas sp. IBARAKI]